jgi:hypothetical protein
MKLTKLFKNVLCAFAAVSLSIFTVSCDKGAEGGDTPPVVEDAVDKAADAAKEGVYKAADAVKDATASE